MPPPGEPLLEVAGLSISFAADGRPLPVVEDVAFRLEAGQALGLVGESGCGKSVTAMAIMRLIPSPPGRVERGRVLFQGEDLLALDERAMRAIRGNRIGMIFQEPMTSLNPVFTVGFQIGEVLKLHRGLKGQAVRREAERILDLVGVGMAARRLGQYPHELSGGLRQRVMIAMALACDPDLLIADEPTTALDVTIQAQILELINSLRAEFGMSVLMISHDLGVVAEVCEQVVVMYAGRVVEQGPVTALFTRPRHPYTLGLLASSPRLGVRRETLPTIGGMVPAPGARGPGCAFTERCPRALDRCRVELPSLTLAGGQGAACWNPSP